MNSTASNIMMPKNMKEKITSISKRLLCVLALLPLSFTQSAFADTAVKTNTAKLSSPANLVDQENPYKMIEEVAGLTFKRFADEQQEIRNNPNILKDIVREELMPYINYKYSAFKVIGQQLKKTTKQERNEFVPVFREYLVTSYAQVFTLYDNQEVVFSPEKNFAGKKIIAVNTRVVMSGRNDINVAFKVRKNSKNNTWQAFDMIAEGVSLLDSKQAELGSIIRQKGLPYVTNLLRKKSDRNIVFKDSNAKTTAANNAKL
jgi:phospholipid transport system substrate-binding protein